VLMSRGRLEKSSPERILRSGLSAVRRLPKSSQLIEIAPRLSRALLLPVVLNSRAKCIQPFFIVLRQRLDVTGPEPQHRGLKLHYRSKRIDPNCC
jgi:hypothetical protein